MSPNHVLPPPNFGRYLVSMVFGGSKTVGKYIYLPTTEFTEILKSASKWVSKLHCITGMTFEG